MKTSRQTWRMASCSFSTFWLLSCKVIYRLILQKHFLVHPILAFRVVRFSDTYLSNISRRICFHLRSSIKPSLIFLHVYLSVDRRDFMTRHVITSEDASAVYANYFTCYLPVIRPSWTYTGAVFRNAA